MKDCMVSKKKGFFVALDKLMCRIGWHLWEDWDGMPARQCRSCGEHYEE